MENSSQISNIIFGAFSLLSIFSGFILKEYQFLFWIGGFFLLVITVISSYLFDTREKSLLALQKLKKIEEVLNIHNRLGRLELKMDEIYKRGQVNLIEVIKWGLAIILLIALFKAITSIN